MAPDGPPEPTTDRESPVGEPVIRGDPTVVGDHAAKAEEFDPEDGASLARAAEVVMAFADDTVTTDSVYMLRGAAACAALVRGEGSYKAATERTDDAATVSFIRKWARVHDLPRPIRQYVATGEIAPTAAKHIARVTDEARFSLAWAVLDSDLTVREVRAVASAVNDETPIEEALADHDVTLGEMTFQLPIETYTELRCRAALEGVDPAEIIAAGLEGDDAESTAAERY